MYEKTCKSIEDEVTKAPGLVLLFSHSLKPMRSFTFGSVFFYIYIVFKCIFLYYNTQGGNIVKYCNCCVCQLVKYLGKNIWGFKNSIFFSLYRTKNGGTYWTILYCCIPNIHTDPTTTEEMYCKYGYTSLFPSVFWVCFSVHCLAHHFYHSPLLHFSTTAIYNFYYCSMCKIIY